MLDALDQLKAALRDSALPSDEIEDGIDAVAATRVELEGDREPGRLKRLITKVKEWAEKIGQGTIAGLFVAYAKSELGW